MYEMRVDAAAKHPRETLSVEVDPTQLCLDDQYHFCVDPFDAVDEAVSYSALSECQCYLHPSCEFLLGLARTKEEHTHNGVRLDKSRNEVVCPDCAE